MAASGPLVAVLLLCCCLLLSVTIFASCCSCTGASAWYLLRRGRGGPSVAPFRAGDHQWWWDVPGSEYDKDRSRYLFSKLTDAQLRDLCERPDAAAEDAGGVALKVSEYWKPGSTPVQMISTRHFTLMFHELLDVPDSVFWANKSFVSTYKSDPDYRKLKMRKWVTELLYNMEDWFAYVTRELGFVYNWVPALHPDATIKATKYKSCIIVSDLLKGVETNNPPLSKGMKFGCSACSADFHSKTDLNVNAATSRGWPISGGIAHEFGHCLCGPQLACYSESLGQFFMLMLVLGDKTWDGQYGLGIQDKYMNSHFSINATGRYRYQEPYLFGYLAFNVDGYKLKDPEAPADAPKDLEPLKAVAAWGRAAKRWNQSDQKQAGDMWDTLEKLLGGASLAEFLTRYNMRVAVCDLAAPAAAPRMRLSMMRTIKQWITGDARNIEHERKRYWNELYPVPDDAGRWKVCDSVAPQQAGFNMVRFQASARQASGATVTLHPLYDATLKSRWGFMLARVPGGDVFSEAADYAPTYSAVGVVEQAPVTLTLGAAFEPADWLVVVVVPVPRDMAELTWTENDDKYHPTDCPIKMRHPYELSVTSAFAPVVRNGGRDYARYLKYDLGTFLRHGNGGGLKHPQAQVDATAYLGPDCLAFEKAVIKGGARVQDRAYVVAGTVQDSAVVGGHSVVVQTMDGAPTVVKGNARMWDCAYINGATLADDARLLEHGMLSFVGDPPVQAAARGNATVKGCAFAIQPKLGGHVTIDGDFFSSADDYKARDLTFGCLTGHERGSHWQKPEYEAKIMDSGGWYLHYSFNKGTSLQVFDTYNGITYGLLRNGAVCDKAAGLLRLSAPSKQYMLLNRTVLYGRRVRLLLKFRPSVTGAAPLLTLGTDGVGFLTLALNGSNQVVATATKGNSTIQATVTSATVSTSATNQVTLTWDGTSSFVLTLAAGGGGSTGSASFASPAFTLEDLTAFRGRALCGVGVGPQAAAGATFDGTFSVVAISYIIPS